MSVSVTIMAATRAGGNTKAVLVFGLTTLDIVNICEIFPEEDEDVRVLNQYWQKGGNAANTSEVLAQLGHEAHLFSAFAVDNAMSDFAKNYLKYCNVVTKHCVALKSSGFPTSCCIVSKSTGSRTILHGRNDMPELTLEHFKMIDFTSGYSWVHFEGRGFPHLKEMVHEAVRIRKDRGLNFKISIEFEKPQRHDFLISSGIAKAADVLFISKDFAKRLGFSDAKDAILNAKNKLSLNHDLTVICPWGESGASAIDEFGNTFHSDSFPPENVIDTLGAGDTFIAGIIFSMSTGSSVGEALVFGCQLAGKKCGQYGFKDLI